MERGEGERRGGEGGREELGYKAFSLRIIFMMYPLEIFFYTYLAIDFSSSCIISLCSLKRKTPAGWVHPQLSLTLSRHGHQHLGFSHTSVLSDIKVVRALHAFKMCPTFSLRVSSKFWWHILQVPFSGCRQKTSLEGVQTTARTDIPSSKSFTVFWTQHRGPVSHTRRAWRLCSGRRRNQGDSKNLRDDNCESLPSVIVMELVELSQRCWLFVSTLNVSRAGESSKAFPSVRFHNWWASRGTFCPQMACWWVRRWWLRDAGLGSPLWDWPRESGNKELSTLLYNPKCCCAMAPAPVSVEFFPDHAQRSI